MTAARLTVEGLNHSHAPGTQTLTGVTLDVEPGSLTCVLGPSGSGKTSLLRIIAGSLQPDAGDVRLDGTPILALPPEARDIGMVFQSYALFPHLSALDNVAFGLRARGVKTSERRRAAMAALAQVGLTEAEAHRRPSALSGGQQQRVALARALVVRPRLLLLDEPLANLDRHLRDRLREELRALHAGSGTTTLLVTHDQTEAFALASHIALLVRGHVIAHDTPEALYARPPCPFVARFLGEANLYRAEAVDGDAVRVSGATLRCDRPVRAGQALLVRPESIVLGTGELSATITAVRFDGADRIVTLTGSLPARARVRGDLPLSPGATVSMFIPPSAIWPLPDEDPAWL